MQSDNRASTLVDIFMRSNPSPHARAIYFAQWVLLAGIVTRFHVIQEQPERLGAARAIITLGVPLHIFIETGFLLYLVILAIATGLNRKRLADKVAAQTIAQLTVIFGVTCILSPASTIMLLFLLPIITMAELARPHQRFDTNVVAITSIVLTVISLPVGSALQGQGLRFPVDIGPPLLFAISIRVGAFGTVMLVAADLGRARRRVFGWMAELLDHLGCGIDIIDPNFRIAYANAKHQSAFSDCEGKICYRRIKGRYRPCRACPVRTALEHNYGEAEEKVRGRRYRVTATRLPSSRDGEPHCIEVIEDLTDVFRSAERAAQHRDDAWTGLHAHVQHLATRKLNTIEGRLQVLSRALSQGRAVTTDDIESCMTIVGEAKEGINALADTNNMDVIPTAHTLSELEEFIRDEVNTHTARGAVTIECDLPETRCWMDLARMDASVRELVCNAAKHNSYRVGIKVYAEDSPGLSGYVDLVFEQDQPVDSRTHGRLFERHLRGDGATQTQGAGMGLWSVRWVAQKQATGGTALYDSKRSAFVLRLAKVPEGGEKIA